MEDTERKTILLAFVNHTVFAGFEFYEWLLVDSPKGWIWPCEIEDLNDRLAELVFFKDGLWIYVCDVKPKEKDEHFWALSSELMGDERPWDKPFAAETLHIWDVLKMPKTLSPHPPVALYHGTDVIYLESILKNSFRLPVCTKGCLERKKTCTCHMMGKCLYFAKYDKAFSHAKQTSDWKKRSMGCVLRCAIRLGDCRTQPKIPCSCCGKPYVDHPGAWMTHPFNSLYLAPNSLPATRRPEWCVKDPKQVTVLDLRVVRSKDS